MIDRNAPALKGSPLPFGRALPHLAAMDSVDLALILAFDGSASVTFDEFGLMTGGCEAALRDPEVVDGLLGGPAGASLAAVILWSGRGAHEIMVPWMRLAAPPDVAAFAQAVADMPRVVRAGTTALGEALLLCETMLAGMPAQATRRVIDVAGDGRSNDGIPPAPVRDRLVGEGVTINGLCVLHEEPDLVQSYTNEVIGGAGAFALACADYAGFADAMRQKLAREIAAAGGRVACA
jgi:Ca-activated chloride channel family protein